VGSGASGRRVRGTRTKGTNGEREAAAIWEAHGFDVRGLESGGDHLVLGLGGLVFAQETKRAERVRLPEWLEQAEGDAPEGSIPLLTYRQNREPWRTVIRTDHLAAIIAQLAEATKGGRRK
jgi:hypothetical protein